MSGANGTTPLRKRLAAGDKVNVTKLAKGGCAMPMSPMTKVKRANGVKGLKSGGKAGCK